MAQTASGVSFYDCYIGLNATGTYVDISGFSNSVDVTGGERQTGSAFTADGDTPIITIGKREPITVTVRAVYTVGAAGVYSLGNDQYESGSGTLIQWSPEGNDSGEHLFTSATGVVKNPVYPTGDVSAGDPIAIELVLECASVTESTV